MGFPFNLVLEKAGSLQAASLGSGTDEVAWSGSSSSGNPNVGEIDDDPDPGSGGGGNSDYFGDNDSYDTDSTTTTSGDYSLVSSSSSGGTLQTTDLWVSVHDVISLDVNSGANGSPFQFQFGVQNDGADYYAVEIDVANDTVDIIKSIDGTETVIGDENGTPSFALETWYEVEIRWYEHTEYGWGNLDVFIYDSDGNEVIQADAYDTDILKGGIGFSSQESGVNFDNVHLAGRAGRVDDFEDNDMIEYESDGEAISEDFTFYGSNALQTEAQELAYSMPTGLIYLDFYPQQGDRFEAKHYLETGEVACFAFGVKDTDNRYHWAIDEANGSISLQIKDNGIYTTLDEVTGLTIPTTEWLRAEAHWDKKGNIDVTVEDESATEIATVSATDSTFTAGGVGWGDATKGTPLVDDWEDGDITEYTGDTGQFAADSTVAYEGSYSMSAKSSGNIYNIASTSGLNAYPAPGDTFEFYVYLNDLEYNGSIGWGAQDTSNYYSINISPASTDAFKLAKYKNGSNSNIASSTNLTYSTGVWYRIEVSWASDGTMTADIYDDTGTKMTGVSGTDTEWTKGGIAVRANTPNTTKLNLDNYNIIG